MRVLAAEIRRLELKLVESIRTASERHSKRPLVLVHVETDVGPGDGECDALATSRYSGESIDSAERELVTHLIPSLVEVDRNFASRGEAMAYLGVHKNTQMAVAALEMALLDADLKSAGRSLASYLGASRNVIVAGATIGIGSIRSVVSSAESAVAEGISRLKLKISPGNDVEPLTAIRAALPDADLIADANGSYQLARREDREVLAQIDSLGLAAIEQPLPPDAFEDHARLTDDLATPVLLDESIASVEDLERAIELRACSGIAIKPARLGGISAARDIHDRCVEEGLRLSIGGLFEGGLGRAASIAVGALEGFDLPGDLGPSARYFADDITDQHVLVDGNLPVPTGPGLGVELRMDVVDSVTTRSRLFKRS